MDYSYYDRRKITYNKKKQSVWVCVFCKQEYVDTGRTANARRHLNKKHANQLKGSLLKSHNSKRIDTYQGQIDMAKFRIQSQVANNKIKRCKLDDGTYEEVEDVVRELDPDVLKNLYIKWITCCGVPFEMVEREGFRA